MPTISQAAEAFEKAKAEVDRIDAQLMALKAEREEATERVKTARAAVMDALSLRTPGSGRKAGKAQAAVPKLSPRFGKRAREIMALVHERGSIRMADYARTCGAPLANVSGSFYNLEKAGHLLKLGRGLYGPATPMAAPVLTTNGTERERTGSNGLGKTAQAILDLLARSGPLRNKDIADKLKMAHSAVGWQTRQLKGRGLVVQRGNRRSPFFTLAQR
jgi:DNA-binding transcriptional ArsR family regulator